MLTVWSWEAERELLMERSPVTNKVSSPKKIKFIAHSSGILIMVKYCATLCNNNMHNNKRTKSPYVYIWLDKITASMFINTLKS